MRSSCKVAAGSVRVNNYRLIFSSALEQFLTAAGTAPQPKDGGSVFPSLVIFIAASARSCLRIA
jgi:hypothetical protein